MDEALDSSSLSHRRWARATQTAAIASILLIAAPVFALAFSEGRPSLLFRFLLLLFLWAPYLLVSWQLSSRRHRKRGTAVAVSVGSVGALAAFLFVLNRHASNLGSTYFFLLLLTQLFLLATASRAYVTAERSSEDERLRRDASGAGVMMVVFLTMVFYLFGIPRWHPDESPDQSIQLLPGHSSERIRTYTSEEADRKGAEETVRDRHDAAVGSVEDKVRQIIAGQLGLEPGSVTLEASLTDDLGADELDMVLLLMQFEDAFDLEIPGEHAERIVTGADAVEYIKRKGE
jgi:acyl carrier protein